jgi:hypothetical protein
MHFRARMQYRLVAHDRRNSPVACTSRHLPQAPSKTRRTFVDPALALNESGKWFRTRLALRCIPQHARPLRSRSPIDLLTVRGAKDHHRKWFVGICCIHALQLQRPTCPADGAIFRRPPHHKVEHGSQIVIDRVASPTALATLPSKSDSEQILPQCLRGVRYFIPNGFSQSRRSQPKIRGQSFEV